MSTKGKVKSQTKDPPLVRTPILFQTLLSLNSLLNGVNWGVGVINVDYNISLSYFKRKKSLSQMRKFMNSVGMREPNFVRFKSPLICL